MDCGRQFSERLGACGYCFALGRLVPVPERDVAGVDYVAEEMAADELVRAAWSDVPTRYAGLRLGTKSLVLMSGPEGAQKSTMVVRMLDSIAGPVVLLAAEMLLGPALGALLARCAVKRRDFVCLGACSVDYLHERVTRLRAVALGIDSVQATTMGPGELRHLLAATPLRLVVAVSQLNASGEPYGARALRHECDIHIEVADGRWSLRKSRFQREASGTVMEEVAA